MVLMSVFISSNVMLSSTILQPKRRRAALSCSTETPRAGSMPLPVMMCARRRMPSLAWRAERLALSSTKTQRAFACRRSSLPSMTLFLSLSRSLSSLGRRNSSVVERIDRSSKSY
jgi:hypothetical protein